MLCVQRIAGRLAKQCSHCQRWTCGGHAEWHIYKVQGEVIGNEVICHECERLGHKPLDLAAAARAGLAGPERKQQKAKRKRQKVARKRNRR